MNSSPSFIVLRHLRWAIPLIALALLIYATGNWVEQREVASRTIALKQAAETNVLGLRSIVERNNYLPFAAARYPSIKALLNDPGNERIAGNANRDLEALQKESGAAALFLIDAKGKTLAASNWNTPSSFVGQFYPQRPYFEEALGGKRGYFYGVGLTTGKPGLFIADPVHDGSKIPGVLVVKVSLDTIDSTWSKSANPIALQDKLGIVFLSSTPEWLYRAENQLSPNELKWLNLHGQYGNRQTYELLNWNLKPTHDADVFKLKAPVGSKDREFLALSTELPELGWKLTVTSNFSEIMQSRSEAQAIVGLIGALIGMGYLYLRLRDKRRKEQIRAEAERDQQEKELQLQRTARLASVGEMASTLAHELNQPLMALSNFAVATRSMLGSAPSEILASALDDIIQQSKRASEIVRRVRSFINPQRGNYEYLGINDVITHAIEMLQAELQRTPATVNTLLAPGLAQVRGDKVLLEQVIVNMVQNAIHAQLDKPAADRAIDISTHFHNNTIQIQVTDQGTGVSVDKMGQIFTPFFTTKTDGLGLGLNICRTIVEAHGGSISVSNSDSGGAIFTITLPLVQ